jgi:hypothetical protein
LCTVGHEAFEIWILNSVATYDGVEILPDDHLGSDVLTLLESASKPRQNQDTCVETNREWV